MSGLIYYAKIGNEYTMVMVGRDPEQLMLASRALAEESIECPDCMDEEADDVRRLEVEDEEWAVEVLVAVEQNVGGESYENGWQTPGAVTGMLACDSMGESVGPFDQAAERWCAAGAAMRVADDYCNVLVLDEAGTVDIEYVLLGLDDMDDEDRVREVAAQTYAVRRLYDSFTAAGGSGRFDGCRSEEEMSAAVDKVIGFVAAAAEMETAAGG